MKRLLSVLFVVIGISGFFFEIAQADLITSPPRDIGGRTFVIICDDSNTVGSVDPDSQVAALLLIPSDADDLDENCRMVDVTDLSTTEQNQFIQGVQNLNSLEEIPTYIEEDGGGLVIRPSNPDQPTVDPSTLRSFTACETPPTFVIENGRQRLQWPTTGCIGLSYDPNNPSEVSEIEELYSVGQCWTLNIQGYLAVEGEQNTYESCYYTFNAEEPPLEPEDNPDDGGDDEDPSTTPPPTGTPTGGLVPEACEDPSTCGSCEFVELINNVIQFIMQIAVLLAVIVFVYAGFLMVSSQGNEGQITKSKTLFLNVTIGLVIILAAFAIVNAVLSAFLAPGNGALNWQRVVCVSPIAPPTGLQDISRIRNNFDTPSGSGILGPGLLDGAFYSNEGVCNADFLSDYFSGQDITIARCVADGESACGAYFESTTDRGRDDSSFSLSAFQINISVHNIEGCAQFGAASDNLNCPAAFNGRNYSSVVSNPDLYRQCAEALADRRCAALNASRLRDRDGWGIWSAYSANGCNR